MGVAGKEPAGASATRPYEGPEPILTPDTSKVLQIDKDIRDIEAEDLQGFEGIIHLAGLSNDPLGDLNPKLTYQINHAAAVRLAALAKKAKTKRFIVSSSCSIYGFAFQRLHGHRFRRLNRDDRRPLCLQRDSAPYLGIANRSQGTAGAILHLG